jgi:hypothetical protein
MFTGKRAFTAGPIAYVEKFWIGPEPQKAGAVIVIDDRLLESGTIWILNCSRDGIWGKSRAFMSTTSHESNQTPSYYNKRFFKILSRQTR